MCKDIIWHSSCQIRSGCTLFRVLYLLFSAQKYKKYKKVSTKRFITLWHTIIILQYQVPKVNTKVCLLWYLYHVYVTRWSSFKLFNCLLQVFIISAIAWCLHDPFLLDLGSIYLKCRSFTTYKTNSSTNIIWSKYWPYRSNGLIENKNKRRMRSCLQTKLSKSTLQINNKVLSLID